MTKRVCIISALAVFQVLSAQDTTSGKPLSLKEALIASVENNLNVKVFRETKAINQYGVEAAEGAYDWVLGSNLQFSRQKNPSGIPDSKSTTQTTSLAVRTSKLFDWGGNIALGVYPTHSKTEFLGSSTAKPYDGSFSAEYTHPLLNGAGRNIDKGFLVLKAKNESEAAEYTFRSSLINLVAQTESLYWDVVNAHRNRENKLQALELAKKQLKENQVKVEVGTMAPIDVTQAEATVAAREQDIIDAENQLLNSQDALIKQIYPTGSNISAIQPTDAPTLSPITLDEKTAEKIALENQPDLKRYKLDLATSAAYEKDAKNATLPILDAKIGYNATSDNHSAFGPVNGDIFGARYPGYTVGLSFSIPLPNRRAKASLNQAMASRRISELNLKNKELEIALNARTAFRSVESSSRSVKAAEKTRYFSEKDLDAEQKKYENGMSTNFLVLTKQTALDEAKARELKAQIDYAKAQTELERALGRLVESRELPSH